MNLISKVVYPSEEALQRLSPSEICGGMLDLSANLMLAAVVGSVLIGIGSGLIMKRLRSHDIRDVEVITNPGAAYDASVAAVVRIKTRRQQGEGLSGKMDLNDSQALANGNNNLSSSVNMNYRHGKEVLPLLFLR